MNDIERQIRIVKLAADLCIVTMLLTLEAVLILLFLTGVLVLWPLVAVLLVYAVGCACFLVTNTVFTWLRSRLREALKDETLHMTLYIVSSSIVTVAVSYHILVTHLKIITSLVVKVPNLAYDHTLGLGIGVLTAGVASTVWRTVRELKPRDTVALARMFVKKQRDVEHEEEDDVVVIS